MAQGPARVASGSSAWVDITGKPSTFPPSAHTHPATDVIEDTTHRFVADAEKITWNAKVSFPGFGTSGTTAAVGNDARLSDARTPTAHSQAWSTITTTPTTLTGYGITDAQPLDSDLTALATNATNGLWARTGAGTGSARTITGTADQVIVTNGDGVAGNPTLALPQSIATNSTPQFARIGIGGAADGTKAVYAVGDVESYAGSLVSRGYDTISAGIIEAQAYNYWSTPTYSGTAIIQHGPTTAGTYAGLPIAGLGILRFQNNSAGLIATNGAAPIAFATHGAERMRVAENGNVGIGVGTTPSAKLEVYVNDGNSSSTTGLYVCDTANTGYFVADLRSNWTDNNGGDLLRVRNASGNAILVKNNRALQLAAYGAGTLQTDSSGNVTASSDASLKTVTGSFTRGLADVLKLTPRTYHWNEKSGMNTEDENVGFIAQEVLTAVPEAVGQYRTTEMEIDGKKTKKREKSELLTLSDRPLIAALVNAVKELKADNDALRARIASLEARQEVAP